jgi:hypothetical protein
VRCEVRVPSGMTQYRNKRKGRVTSIWSVRDCHVEPCINPRRILFLVADDSSQRIIQEFSSKTIDQVQGVETES